MNIVNQVSQTISNVTIIKSKSHLNEISISTGEIFTCAPPPLCLYVCCSKVTVWKLRPSVIACHWSTARQLSLCYRGADRVGSRKTNAN